MRRIGHSSRFAWIASVAIGWSPPSDRILFFSIQREDLVWVPGRTTPPSVVALTKEIQDSLRELKGDVVWWGQKEDAEQPIGIAVFPGCDAGRVRELLESRKFEVKRLRVTGIAVDTPGREPPRVGFGFRDYFPVVRDIHWDPERKLYLLFHYEKVSGDQALRIGKNFKGTLARESFDLEIQGDRRERLKETLTGALRGMAGIRVRSVDEKTGRFTLEVEMRALEAMEGGRTYRDVGGWRAPIGEVLGKLRERGIEAKLL
ncbi:MAG: hypothetical protein L0323_10660 [Planctomycetes bacterium]|nr:hypothetical protein [Planctomycetota bacterium]